MHNKLKQEYDELLDIRTVIENSNFQKYIVERMRKYQDNQRNNFFSDSLKESWRKGGRVEAVKFFFENLKQIDVDFKNKRDELEAEQE